MLSLGYVLVGASGYVIGISFSCRSWPFDMMVEDESHANRGSMRIENKLFLGENQFNFHRKSICFSFHSCLS